eukprot:3453789-Amphidinium_carterae.1
MRRNEHQSRRVNNFNDVVYYYVSSHVEMCLELQHVSWVQRPTPRSYKEASPPGPDSVHGLGVLAR